MDRAFGINPGAGSLPRGGAMKAAAFTGEVKSRGDNKIVNAFVNEIKVQSLFLPLNPPT